MIAFDGQLGPWLVNQVIGIRIRFERVFNEILCTVTFLLYQVLGVIDVSLLTEFARVWRVLTMIIVLRINVAAFRVVVAEHRELLLFKKVKVV